MYIKRHLEKEVLNGSKNYPVVMILGARQVGKSTLFKQLKEENRKYVTLDDPKNRLLAQNEPELFLDKFSAPVLIDEVQYAPNLFPYIKMKVDSDSQNGLFWLTGSQAFHLMQGVTESLAGRVLLLNLYGLSLSEINARQGASFPLGIEDYLKTPQTDATTVNVFERIIRGSFPRIVTNPDIAPDGFYSSYLQTYLQRDIFELGESLNTNLFIRLIELIAIRTAQELNMSSLAKELGVDSTTVKRWLNILERANIIYLLKPYSGNLSKRIIKRPKIYITDTGLACYLCGINSADLLEKSPLKGAMFETFIVNEILKSWYHIGKTPHVFYYRDNKQKEIDLIIEKDGIVYPFEIKTSTMPKMKNHNFKIIMESELSTAYSGIICLSDEPVPIEKNIWLIPSKYI